MDQLFEDVIAKFESKKALFTGAGLKAPFIDFYMGQPEHPEFFEFTLPAVFMDYSIVPMKQGLLWVNATTLSFHCIPEIAPSASSISPRRTQGLKQIIWYGLVKDVLDTVTGRHYTSLTRGHESPSYTPDFKYHIINYTTEMDNLSGKAKGRYAAGEVDELGISGEIKSRFSL
ncbi:hypothetical protein BDD43_3406 [Mucilaginibacter gracilis]|uniref:Uncharacterized protein n=1 Tax=Mucilaginibacter gracilis TaxID=423350 RepID=A0A495J4D8_9SPHI|nr:hypothetical protein [Mucilaginibacter gracilis]RKR83204.1 hypothetical protein BDD43_3406 [Mucilaginibacter gracilis]